MPGIYQTIFGLCNLLLLSLGPPIAIFLLGLGTIRNIHKILGRIAPDNQHVQIRQNQRRKSIDRDMIQMMSVQCIAFILTTLPPSLHFLYKSLKSSIISDDLELARDSLLSNIANSLSLTVPCTSFYLFILSSKLFRNEFVKLFKNKM